VETELCEMMSEAVVAAGIGMHMKAKLKGIRAKASPAKKKKLCDRYAEVLRLRQKIIETLSTKPMRDARPTLN
jgi:hypothetical protein